MDDCPNCEAPQDSPVRYCASCGASICFPNVYVANVPAEVSALDSRFQAARNKADAAGALAELEELLDEIEEKSRVVVSMPVEVALGIVSNPRYLYTNIEQLVGANVYSPGSFAKASHRNVVAGTLFGSFGDSIVYGALALNDQGLGSYGEIYCTLKTKSVEERTSFLEVNSYDFVDKYQGVGLPKGYRSDWQNRSKLVATKMQESGLIDGKEKLNKWENALLVSNGVDHSEDIFVEAHIYGTFSIHSINQMASATVIDKSKKELVKHVIAGFSAL